MSTVVYQKNKRTGLTYAYESISHWDRDKKQSRARRRCIGRVDPATGDIVPTRPRKAKEEPASGGVRPGPVPVVMAGRHFCGATCLFDQIGESLGITEDLQACFPDRWKQLLSLAYFLILEDRNPLSRFPAWARIHRHPLGAPLGSQRSSDLFASITEDERQRFFALQGARRTEGEYLAYDSTSISSYSRSLRQVRWGKNKEHDPLAQLNLLLLFGQTSGLPFHYRKLSGNIPDVSSLTKLLKDLEVLGYDKVKMVFDRGFFSRANINGMYRHHIKFIIGTKLSLNPVRQALDTHREALGDFVHYIPDHDLYGMTRMLDWEYEQERPYKKDILKEKRRIYLHLYYSPGKAYEDEQRFLGRLTRWQEELRSGKPVEDNRKAYETYFTVSGTPERGLKVLPRQDVLDETRRNYGYFALLGNDTLSARDALDIYRRKDVVEKAFGNLKERLNMRRMAVSSEHSLDGKVFVEFIALIYLSHLLEKMKQADLFKSFTLTELLDELDVIECFEVPGKLLHIGEVTQKQKNLYDALGVKPPASLYNAGI